MKFTPENITKLEQNQIFVFGSNTKGIHGAGAAKFARSNFGAEWGIGEGLTGQCYAFPTKGYNIETLSLDDIDVSVIHLLGTVVVNTDKEFLLTKVGCGLAGLEIKDIANLFKKYKPLPSNLVLPKEFYDIIYDI